MKKIILTGLVLLFSLNIYAQSVYQASVNEGFGLKIGLLADIWNADVIVDQSVVTPGLNIGAKFGITEQITVFGNYQYSFKTTVKDGKEISYLIFHNAAQHQNFNVGLQYNFGSTASKLRYNMFVGAIFARNINDVHLETTNAYIDLQLDGSGFMAGGSIHYFFLPYLSVSLDLQYGQGKYKQSEFLGLTYTEALKFSRIQTIIGLNYHFGGR